MKKARILVVDDEAAVTGLAGQILAKRGHEVFCSTSPREAVKTVLAGQRFELVLSDVAMPEMSGPELVFEVQKHSPSTAALFMSGYVTNELPPHIPIVQKPFTADQLASAVSRVLREAEEALKESSRAREENRDLRANSGRLLWELKQLAHEAQKIIRRSEEITGRLRAKPGRRSQDPETGRS